MIAAHTHHQMAIRPLALVLVLFGELMAVSLSFDAYQPALVNSGQWFEFISYTGQIAKMLVAVMVFSALGLWPRLPDHLHALKQSIAGYPYRYVVTAQFLSFVLFFWCTSALFGQGTGADEISNSLVIAWLATLLATSGFWVLAFAPWRFWLKLVSIESTVFIAAVAVGFLAWGLASFAQTLWTPLSDLTFQLSAAMLNLVYPEIIVDPDLKRLGAQNFVVSIAPACSGYEGMGLMVIFTGFYLAIFRHEFRFPQALLLFPIGIVTIWLFNNLRIVLLISIGASYSPAVAIGGFHSQAGWISFIAVIIVTLMLAYRMPFFSTLPTTLQTTNRHLNLPMALLMPFVVLLGAMILTSALAADFDWLYPVRVIAVALALVGCWRFYGLTSLKVKLEPWLAGIIVFGLWVLLVPDDPTQSEVYSTQLSDASSVTMAVWLLFRFLGSVITVPIAEELLFRGYLLARFARQEIILEGRIAFSWVALILSSLLFGLLHADWVAGIVAGLIFGLVRYRSDSIKDAVIAHASANLLLSLYVISSGNWSLW